MSALDLTTEMVTVHHGDCLDVLRSLPDASVDAVCTDPPYGLEFMGTEWDSFGDVRRANRGGMPNFLNANGSPKFSLKAPAFDLTARGRTAFQEWCELWATECLRILKPGGHMLAFGGTRTFHRLACAVEDAGFEMRDSLAWLYGSGFPKSLNLVDGSGERTGWGTALKPAFEPIVVARKPLAGTVAANVLAHGTGALNIDACRVGDEERTYGPSAAPGGNAIRLEGGDGRDADNARAYAELSKQRPPTTVAGRWPANVILDESQAAELDAQSGEGGSRRIEKPSEPTPNDKTWAGGPLNGARPARGFTDEGGASRFFYVAKADQSERVRVDGIAHPTVKPLALMRWLVRLVTPPGGIVLEPFAGSGTTVEACILEGFRCIAIERDETYLPLIHQRINRRRDPVAAIRATEDDAGLFDLLGEEPA